MKDHINVTKLKNFANGSHSVKESFEIATHLSQCALCRDNLQKIVPDFFITEFSEVAEMTVVKNEKHFSDDEIMAFLKAELPISYRLKISEHLRKCVECKSRLYQKDPQILKTTIADILSKEENTAKKSFFTKLSLPISIGATAILLIGLLSFILLTNKSAENSFQAKVSEKENFNQSGQANSSNTIIQNTNAAQDVATNLKIANTIANQNNSKKITVDTNKTNKTNIIEKNSVSNSLTNTNSLIVANSRSLSNTSNCPPVGIDIIFPSFETITEKQPIFRWKSVPNIVKYHLYISDASQILIEEFETDKDTSYQLKSFLELNKSYRWKVIATDKDGKNLESESVNFSIGKKPKKNRTKRQKNINPTRCNP